MPPFAVLMFDAILYFITSSYVGSLYYVDVLLWDIIESAYRSLLMYTFRRCQVKRKIVSSGTLK